MAVPAPNEIAASVPRPRGRPLAVKVAVLILLGVLLGAGYDWAASRLYGTQRVAGFHLGVVHGALMPAALPTLLMGKDVPIYAPNNSGRLYKLGYIGGINLCGLVFFGFAFKRPRRG